MKRNGRSGSENAPGAIQRLWMRGERIRAEAVLLDLETRVTRAKRKRAREAALMRLTPREHERTPNRELFYGAAEIVDAVLRRRGIRTRVRTMPGSRERILYAAW